MQTKGIFSLIFIFFLGSLTVASQYTENDWKERDEWMDVDRIFQLVNLKPGDAVGDVGCHEGYLSMHLAREVGTQGSVYSVDIKSYRLEALKENAKKRKLLNVTTILGDYDNPKLPEKSLDIVFVMDTYHEMEDYMTILGHIKKALKPGGRILILEKLKDHVKGKSRSAQTNSHSLSPKYVKKELKEAGFTVTEEVRNMGNWENESSKKIWLLVATVPSA